MLKIKCPKCRVEMEAPNEAAGHHLACECGAKWELPSAPPEGDFRVCVNCSRLCEASAALCPECSFNFLTGRAFGSTRYDSGESRRGPLIFKTVFFLLIVLAGVLIYFYATAPATGVSAKYPIGRMDGSGQKFNKLEFVRGEDGLLRYHASTMLISDRISLEAGPKGKVLAAVIAFNAGRNLLGFSQDNSPAKLFYERMRRELAIPEIANWDSKESGDVRSRTVVKTGSVKTPAYVCSVTRRMTSSGTGADDLWTIRIRLREYPESKLNALDAAEEESVPEKTFGGNGNGDSADPADKLLESYLE